VAIDLGVTQKEERKKKKKNENFGVFLYFLFVPGLKLGLGC
jgi:hypothetical protein